jgi:hypothetical protein
MSLPFPPQRLPNISLGVFGRAAIFFLNLVLNGKREYKKRNWIGTSFDVFFFFKRTFDLGFDSLTKIGGSLGAGLSPFFSL